MAHKSTGFPLSIKYMHIPEFPFRRSPDLSCPPPETRRKESSLQILIDSVIVMASEDIPPNTPRKRMSISPRRTSVLLMSRSFRPHNKSPLWEEYYEHYDSRKEIKFFNKKHKKAFCKRCISDQMAQIEASPQARTMYEQSEFADGWNEWKFRQAFERVEPISGRSSNMQRHIKTCVHITPQERSRIMADFEASQGRARTQAPTVPTTGVASSAASSSGDAARTAQEEDAGDEEEEDDILHEPRGLGHTPTPTAAGLPTAAMMMGRAVSAPISDDVDHSCSSATSSPALTSAPTKEGSPMQLDSSRPYLQPTTHRRSSKFSLRDILNEPHVASDNESSRTSGSGGTSTSTSGLPPPRWKGKGVEKPADPFSPRSTGFGYTTSPGPEELIARLDNAIRELSLVRQSLTGSSTFTAPRPAPPPPDVQSDTSALVAYLRRDLESVRQENETLRKRLQYCSTKERNADLESRLQRETSDPGGSFSEDNAILPGTTRAHSAPALFSPSPRAPGKKRKLSGGGGDDKGY